jgi:predicted DsbA family dithiol-disulfide isomerase
MQLDVYSDAICPWCFIGKRRLDRALTPELAPAVNLDWRAYQLYPQIPVAGMDRDDFMQMRFGGKDKVRDGYSRIEQEGAGEGIAFNFRGIRRMPNTRNAHRLSILAAHHGVQTALVEQLFQMHFIDGQDVGDLDTLAEAAQRAGIDRDVAGDYLRGDEGLPQMLEELQFALDAGISGVPCFVINREFGIPGAQPVEVLSRYLTKARDLEALVQR